MSADIGVIGLGVMGSNIALNIADHGFAVSAYNRSPDKTSALLEQATADHNLKGYSSLEEFVDSLKTPRTILLMVTAGEVVDKIIASLQPLLTKGDIIIDGGNSFFEDSQRRADQLQQQGLNFIGMGISGGEDGARFGPSLMPGGHAQAWPIVQPLFQAIAAKATDGTPCCQWVGSGGAGHYVKMVHNGIEYGDMQLICEAWELLHKGLSLPMSGVAKVFAQWNQGKLSSYLMEITAQILTVNDDDGQARVLNILDTAGQKGTGRWTAIDSLKLGMPLTMITEAVFSRALSALKQERVSAAEYYADCDEHNTNVLSKDLIPSIESALYAAKLISYTQGFMQLRQASDEYGWNLDFGNVALLWRAGCIIRSRFLDDIYRAYQNNPQLQSLLVDAYFAGEIKQHLGGWRQTVIAAVSHSIPVSAMSSALAFFDAYTQADSSASLLQAQRDYFGAHSYQRKDRQGTFHTRWSDDQQELQL